MASNEDMSDGLIPDELHRYLQDQIQYLGTRMEMYENPSDAEEDLMQNTMTNGNSYPWQQEHQLMYPSNNSVNSSTRLSRANMGDFKRNSEEEEICKTRRPQSQKKNFTIMQEISTIEIKKSQYELEEQIRSMEDKLGSISVKLSETRKYNKQLRSDLNIANSLLQENIQSITSSNTSGKEKLVTYCYLQQEPSESQDNTEDSEESGKEYSM